MKAAREAGFTSTIEWCDRVSARFSTLASSLNIIDHSFIRTTSSEHRRRVHSIWDRIKTDIYPGTHRGWYCVSEESFYPESRLVRAPNGEWRTAEGNKLVEWVEEPALFFRLTKYLDSIRSWWSEGPIQPTSRMADLEGYLETAGDLCVSRPCPWGISVPNHPNLTIYVWLDALTNYLTASGTSSDFIHVVAAGLPLPRQIVCHGHWTMAGEKMSKSLGNVIDPLQIIDAYGSDALRYSLLRDGRIDCDNSNITFYILDFDVNQLNKVYNTELANQLGNLISRLSQPHFYPAPLHIQPTIDCSPIIEALDQHKFHHAIHLISRHLGDANRLVNETAPWRMKDSVALTEAMGKVWSIIKPCTILLSPIIPHSATKIMQMMEGTKLGLDQLYREHQCQLRPVPSALFPRIK